MLIASPARAGRARASMWLIAGFLVLFGAGCGGNRQAPRHEQVPLGPEEAGQALDNLSWMAGDWHGVVGDGPLQIFEHWEKARGGRILGTSHLLDPSGGGQSLHREFSQILLEEGKVILEMRHGLGDASPHYRYELVPGDASSLVFENTEYSGDRAFRIVYESADERREMMVSVAHREGSELRTSRFQLRRRASAR